MISNSMLVRNKSFTLNSTRATDWFMQSFLEQNIGREAM